MTPVPDLGPAGDASPDHPNGLRHDRLEVEFDLVLETTPPPELDLGELPAVARGVLCAEGASGRWQVAFVMTDDPGLQALHRRFMGLDTPTDVMTFPLGDQPPAVATAGPPIQGGDIVVSVDRAAAQAPGAGTTTSNEIRFLLLHGLLHLLGHDDTTDDQRTAMLARQTALLAAFDAAAQPPDDQENGASLPADPA